MFKLNLRYENNVIWREQQRVLLPIGNVVATENLTKADARAILDNTKSWAIRWETSPSLTDTNWWHVTKECHTELNHLKKKSAL